jgi:hypothetical protein
VNDVTTIIIIIIIMNIFLNKNNMQTTNTPTPQNISKWSLGRKEIIQTNKSLKKQLDSKNSLIEKLESEIKELNIKVKLNGLEIPSSLSDSKDVYFEYELTNNDGNQLTYTVSNYEFGYDTEVQISLNEITEYFEDSEITQRELDSFIRETITEYFEI